MASSYDSLSREKLASEVRSRGLYAKGNRAVLIRRLQKSDRERSTRLDMEGLRSRTQNVDDTHAPPNGMADGMEKMGNGHIPHLSEKEEREGIVLWRRPITTLHYFNLELMLELKKLIVSLYHNRIKLFFFIVLCCLSYFAYYAPGPHQEAIRVFEKKLLWCLYWIGLGVLSSVGLGTGLHTFLLYLGPHIASVTLAAYECESLNFPEPPYPEEIHCPATPDAVPAVVNLWSIMAKVRLEAFMWGAGTALGELPPYFMARAARLSGVHPDDEEYEEFEHLQQIKDAKEMSMMDRAKLGVERLVERVGFFGILACASIPNPLFDLAGITCGHFLVPFWTFFGATLIGKAVVKMHIQMIFVIIAFNESLVESAVDMLGQLPVIGDNLQSPFKEFLTNQKAKLHSKEKDAAQGPTWLQWLFEKLIIVMVLYFVLSIVNSLAQRYHKRLCKLRRSPSKPALVRRKEKD
ncbi:unnamed protein product [Cyprideis torosa]|uniref:Vacuole membrane protein 1 n=1 Tax=Cyprideis torosa TaxID=163714 RepID=A0A7R8WD64_9CRUS|nr:unnamed protein product [Cyprideis torosa]CAG0894244.1 unnamed protein product [Cyprideis torosa]